MEGWAPLGSAREVTMAPLALFTATLLLSTSAIPAQPPGLAAESSTAAHWTLVGWNDLGMHCMDSDYRVFSILPPFNTIHAQLISPDGALVLDPAGAGVVVTYEAVADAEGSENRTSIGKTGFWDAVAALFGVALLPDQGLAGFDMPGPANTPWPLRFDPVQGWFTAEGIPITPRDDAGRRRRYPLLRLVARGPGGVLLATTSIVPPVSDEMSCAACHASGANEAARPSSGWVQNPDPELDYRRNVLRLHDDLHAGEAAYSTALAAAGYAAAGLEATAMAGTPILCARCHPSNALPGSGQSEVSALTASVHALHASVLDPATGEPLDSATHRAACYRCHPGATTKCLRGAMGRAVATDGTLAMQCQDCHGSMSAVGSALRVGWLAQPSCQNCHTGTATHNNGEIRYSTAFEEDGSPRIAVDATFATDADVPAPGFDLFRFSFGHGALACEACHGPTHAEQPSLEANDGVQSLALQGAPGPLADCASCHTTAAPPPVLGGPHGLHPLGAAWVDDHADLLEGAPLDPCLACHGADARYSVLSLARRTWTAATPFGVKTFWRGFRIGCWACHDGPTSDDPSANHPAAVVDRQVATTTGVATELTLTATDLDGDPTELRIVDPPAHGFVGWQGSSATYTPEPGYWGTDRYTYAAWDGSTDSNLGTVAVAVTFPGCPLDECVFADGFESGATMLWWLQSP